MKTKTICTALLTGLLLGTSALTAVADSPKREMRSVWVAGMHIDWPTVNGTTASGIQTQKNQLITMLDNYKAQNFNNICLHVRPRADAYYKSSLEPWSQDLTGTRGKDPGWDPLQFAIEEAHKRGIEIYAWVNPYRVNANGVTYTTELDNQWKANGWLIYSGNWTSFNPGLADARKHCLDVMREIYGNYDIDGMLFDDYFYPGDQISKDSSADDWQTYKNSGTTLSISDWRRENVNNFMKEIFDDIQKTRPDMRFGIGPAGVSKYGGQKYGIAPPSVSTSDWQYDGIYADPVAWMADGSIDFIAPQIYWQRSHSTAAFEPLAKWWAQTAERFGIHNFVSIASYKTSTADFGGDNSTGWGEIQAQVEITRKYANDGAPGAVYYNGTSVNGNNLGKHLGSTVYTSPALVPAVTWKNRVHYNPVEGLAQSGTSLNWTAADRRNREIVRYTVYAVPSSVSYANALSANGDGIDAKYLLGLTYSPSYTLPSDKNSGYWYAVCVYDGLGNESQPSFSGVSVATTGAATLVSPSNNASDGWTPALKWNAVSGATYILEVSSDAQMRQLILEEKNLTSTSYTLDLRKFTDLSTVYWRIATEEKGKLNGHSEIRALNIPEREKAPKAELLTPADKAQSSADELTFRWSLPSSNDVEKILLEIDAANANFTNPLISRELTPAETSLTLPTSRLGNGTYQWRVTVSGDNLVTSVSDVFTFTLSNLRAAGEEYDYVTKVDPATYPEKDNLVLTSLWLRKDENPFNNFEIENNGLNQRGIAALGDKVYMSCRSEGSSNANIFLDEFDGNTGRRLRRLALSEEGCVPFYPCNDVHNDGHGNIVISNLSLNISSTPIILHKVDLTNGALTEVASLSHSDGGRVDHVAIYGDVASGTFSVYAAISSTANVILWKITNGKVSSTTVKTIKSFYPSTATGFSIAPRMHIVSEGMAFIDGYSTAWTYYNVSRNTLVSSFDKNPTLAPTDNSDNGGCTFKLGDKQFAVYNIQPTTQGSRFNIVQQSSLADFSTMNLLWTVPESGLGSVASSTCSAPVAASLISPGVAHIYVYTPANGIAAYRLTDKTQSVENLENDASEPVINVSGRTVTVTSPVATLTAYNTAGAIVATAANATTLTLPVAGTYIIAADNVRRVIVAK